MKRIYLFLFLPALLFPQSAADITQKVETTLLSFKTLQAEFTQVYYSSSVSTPLEEKGRLFLQKPGWMKWVYTEPEEKIFLLKEGLLLEYLPEENQLLEKRLSEQEDGTEILNLLTGERSISEHYTVELFTFPTENKDVYQLKLIPLAEEADTFILLEVNKRTWIMQKLISFDWTGNKQEFQFYDIITDVDFPKNTFELEVPPGTEIIK